MLRFTIICIFLIAGTTNKVGGGMGSGMGSAGGKIRDGPGGNVPVSRASNASGSGRGKIRGSIDNTIVIAGTAGDNTFGSGSSAIGNSGTGHVGGTAGGIFGGTGSAAKDTENFFGSTVKFGGGIGMGNGNTDKFLPAGDKTVVDGRAGPVMV